VWHGDLLVAGCAICINWLICASVIAVYCYYRTLPSLLINVFGTVVRNAGPVIDARRSVCGADLVWEDDL
jgi:hypothetical protein